MASRSYNYRLVKMHRPYSVEKVAELFSVHKNTVRAWIRQGLPVCDGRRPTLILGSSLKHFLEGRQKNRKRRCSTDEMYCVRCRKPQQPLGKMVDFEPAAGVNGRLVGICPACNGTMHRFSSLSKLEAIQQHLEVSIPRGQEHISNSSEPLVNSNFE